MLSGVGRFIFFFEVVLVKKKGLQQITGSSFIGCKIVRIIYQQWRVFIPVKRARNTAVNHKIRLIPVERNNGGALYAGAITIAAGVLWK